MLARANEKGFTLIEVVALLVVVGVLAAVVISYSSTPETYQVVSELETLRTHLRYAQLKAMSHLNGTTWGISVGGSSYQLYNNGAASAIPLPGDTTATHTFPSGVTATTTTITFDDWGSPGTADITVTLTKGGYSQSIRVTKNTGFMS
ncbi:MAG: prepilin-type N-terminal cleavage/methylation domain-containing protein [Nitrospirota bacterium]